MTALETLLTQSADFERFLTQRSGREKPSRYWKVDLDAIDVSALTPDFDAAVSFENVPPQVTVTDLQTALRERPEAFTRVFGQIIGTGKFASLSRAFARIGAFVHVPEGVCADEPLVIRYTGRGEALFPYIVVAAERGSRITILERLDSQHTFVAGAVEILAGESTHVSYSTLQKLGEQTRVIFTRAARTERNAAVAWSNADIGSALSVGSIDTTIASEGAQVDIAAVFFANAAQHIDLVTSVEHAAGHSSSDTIVKSAATERGQGRYLGTIRIERDAQGSDARLRDDALLLSKHAHIDSIPALEIAANDVKAFHGATVGAIDREQLFYVESRGIPTTQAKNMIALAFFEPAIDRFPTEPLREEIRAALSAKIA